MQSHARPVKHFLNAFRRSVDYAQFKLISRTSLTTRASTLSNGLDTEMVYVGQLFQTWSPH
jgi:hypothetical protein